jgi:hypothetical protein
MEGLAALALDEKWGYINERGEKIHCQNGAPPESAAEK